MNINARPGLKAFLKAPIGQVAKVAPTTIIFAAGGTRRSAVLAGISPQSDDYVRWSGERMMACFDLIFRHGIAHIIAFAIISTQLDEVTDVYRKRLLSWVEWGLTNPERLADYKRLQWQVRLLGTEHFPQLQAASEKLRTATLSHTSSSLWWFVVPSHDLLWQSWLNAIHGAQAQTRQEAVRAIYGDDIPPATLYLAFGKPTVSPALFPPFLIDNVQCYWSQKPGYNLSEEEFRTILYDYAYLRPTWREDKSGRAEQVLTHRSAWEHGPIIGLGTRLGPFWYPAPTTLPDEK